MAGVGQKVVLMSNAIEGVESSASSDVSGGCSGEVAGSLSSGVDGAMAGGVAACGSGGVVVKVRVAHGWYDGPQVCVFVEESGVWVPFGCVPVGGVVCDAMEEVDPLWSVDTWPEGVYVFDGCTVSPAPAGVAGVGGVVDV